MIPAYIKNSLRRKLVSSTVVVQLLILAILVWNSIRIAEMYLLQQTENHINEILPLLNASFSAPMLDYDVVVLEELLSEITSQRGVRYIELYSGVNQPMIHQGRAMTTPFKLDAKVHRVSLPQQDFGKVIEVAAPVVLSGRTIGHMRVQFNVSYILQAVHSLRSQGVFIALGGTVLSLIILTALGLVLTRHLKDLTSAAEKFSEGDLNARANVKSEDEIGQTAHAFNEMASNRMYVESALYTLASASSESGINFFEESVKMLNVTFGAEYAFIGLIDSDDRSKIKTKVVAVNDSIVPNIEFPLQNTPCEDVEQGYKQLIPAHVMSLYPHDDILQMMKLESYLAMPLVDSAKKTIGVLVVAHKSPVMIEPWMELILEIFANRIAMELERESATRTLQESESKLQAIIDNAPALISIKDMQGRITMLNRRFDILAGPPATDYVGRSQHGVPQFNSTQQQWQSDLDRIDANGSLEIEEIFEHRDGSRRTYHTVKFPVLEPGSNMPFGICSISTDISERIQAEETIRYMAYRDSLTGLHNRNEFENRVRNAIRSAHEYGHEHTLLYIDLDQFKVINDTCGHGAGDEMLRQLSTILLKEVRERDTMARLGGDEFGLLMENCPLARAQTVAGHLVNLVNEFRFVWEGRTFAVGASIGITTISNHNDSVAEVLKSADLACYAAKDAGRNRYHIYREDDQDLSQRRMEMSWVSVIREALDQENFVLFQQPIISLESDHAEQVMYEHLVRMRSSDGKVILPGSFLSSAERYNLMQDVDRYVIRQVFSYAYSSFDTRPQDSMLFINLSGTSLNDEELVSYIRQQFLAFRIEPSRICFEITETAAIANLNRASHFIKEIRKLGCRIALDDFGSGLSSFSYLKALQVDFLKIDGSFIRNMLDDPMDIAIVEAIQQLGHAAGIKTIAEFVEDVQTMEKLRSIGINYAQGYAIARPELMREEPEPRVADKNR